MKKIVKVCGKYHVVCDMLGKIAEFRNKKDAIEFVNQKPF